MERLKSLLGSLLALKNVLQTLFKQPKHEKDNIFSSVAGIPQDFIAIIRKKKFVFSNPWKFKFLNISEKSNISGKPTFNLSYPDLHQDVIGYSLIELILN